MGARLASGGIADSEGTRVELRVEVRKDVSSARRASESSPRRQAVGVRWPRKNPGRGGRWRTAISGAATGLRESRGFPTAQRRPVSGSRVPVSVRSPSRKPVAHLSAAARDLRRQADFPLQIRPDFLERRLGGILTGAGSSTSRRLYAQVDRD